MDPWRPHIKNYRYKILAFSKGHWGKVNNRLDLIRRVETNLCLERKRCDNEKDDRVNCVDHILRS